MPKKQKKTPRLIVSELKSLLLAFFKLEESKKVRLEARLQQELGEKAQTENPEDIVIRDKFADWTSDVIARRLKRNRRAIPLISSRDFAKLFPWMIDQITKGQEIEVKERKAVEKIMKTVFEHIFKAVHAMVPRGKNPYDQYWRLVTVVVHLSTERGILPAELLKLDGVADEITRRMFTEKQFVAISKQALKKFMDLNVLEKNILQPMLEMFSSGMSDEDRRELEEEVRTELIPQLQEAAEKSRIIINAWIDEEVERIYATS